jgi:hypothetical protein
MKKTSNYQKSVAKKFKNRFERKPDLGTAREKVEKYNRKNPEAKKDIDSCMKFFKQMRGKKDIKSIELMIHAVNIYYKTRILATYSLAKNISKIKNLNERLKKGDPDLVLKIAKFETKNGKVINFFVFATKFCHGHDQSKYPIYDKYVQTSLSNFQKTYPFFYGKINRIVIKL